MVLKFIETLYNKIFAKERLGLLFHESLPLNCYSTNNSSILVKKEPDEEDHRCFLKLNNLQLNIKLYIQDNILIIK